MLDEQKTLQKYGYQSINLSNGSHKKVCIVCDYCQVQCEKVYKTRINSNKIINKDACVKCRFKKREDVSLKRDGVKNSAQRLDVRKKLGNIIVEDYYEEIIKYYNEGYSVSFIADKLNTSSTSLSRYIQQLGLDTRGNIGYKWKKTCIERYGENYGYRFIDKIHTKVKMKYGVDNVFQSNEIKEKIKKSNLIKYGFEYTTQRPKQKKKILETKKKLGLIYTYNGLTMLEWSEKIGYSYGRFTSLVRQHGFETAVDMTPQISYLEKLMMQFLDKNNILYETQYKVDGYKADIYISDKNLIIETDGLYWHSEQIQKNKKYHFDKRKIYQRYGYNSLFFREDEIKNKFDIVQSIILNKLGKSKKIGARQCLMNEISLLDGFNFIEKNHLMGGVRRGKYFGLFYQDELILVLCLIRKKNKQYEILRFCPLLNYNISGGLSKLLKFACSGLSIDSLFTFIDLRYGSGYYLESLGFKQVSCYPSFKWTNGQDSFHRMRFPSNTGYEKGYTKIWDCGQAKWEIVYN